MTDNNLEECVHFENKDIENCLNCNGFGIISRLSFNKKTMKFDCKFYEPKSEYLKEQTEGYYDL